MSGGKRKGKTRREKDTRQWPRTGDTDGNGHGRSICRLLEAVKVNPRQKRNRRIKNKKNKREKIRREKQGNEKGKKGGKDTANWGL